MNVTVFAGVHACRQACRRPHHPEEYHGRDLRALDLTRASAGHETRRDHRIPLSSRYLCSCRVLFANKGNFHENVRNRVGSELFLPFPRIGLANSSMMAFSIGLLFAFLILLSISRSWLIISWYLCDMILL